MALYAIADTHLSFGTDKPMDSFPGWKRLYRSLGGQLAPFGGAAGYWW